MFQTFLVFWEYLVAKIFYLLSSTFISGIPCIMFFIVMILLDVFWNFTPFDDD